MKQALDATTLVVMSNRLDGITREMSNTVIRAARSSTMAVRDFSCSISGAEHDLLSSPEGVPAHVFGAGPSARAMTELHPDFREGDAFLHNDPYNGGSHAADHRILVPVFAEGEHLFTACSTGHVIDCGNALPSTYMPMAVDVYAEGALIFPCVRVQENYVDVADVVRMWERRIRDFEVFYGDYLALLGAARLAERRLKEFCAVFGVETVKAFVREWLDYSERTIVAAIATLPAGRVVGESRLDPFPGVPDGIPIKATIDVDPEAGRVVVDLRDNPDNVPNGLNLTETTSLNAGVTAVLNVLNSKRNPDRLVVPNNSGSFRRVEVLLRENCVAGIPRHPASCSLATTTVGDRVTGAIMSAFAQLGEDVGLAEPCWGLPPCVAVISGHDVRRDSYYIMQLISGSAGGPGGSEGDGWLTLTGAAAGGVAYIDAAELIEQKNPLVIWDKSIRIDSEGAGKNRGAPGNVCIYGPRLAEMQSHFLLEGVINRPRGVRGGGPALGPEARYVRVDGEWEQVEKIVGIGGVELQPGESIVSLSSGGGGYGDPLERDPARVLEDVVDEWISVERAREAYGVLLNGDPTRWETLSVDEEATALERSRRREDAARQEGHRRPQDELRWWAGADLAGNFVG